MSGAGQFSSGMATGIGVGVGLMMILMSASTGDRVENPPCDVCVQFKGSAGEISTVGDSPSAEQAISTAVQKGLEDYRAGKTGKIIIELPRPSGLTPGQ